MTALAARESPHPRPAPGRVAALAMYGGHPRLEAANHALWAALRDALRAQGLAGIPASLDTGSPHDAAWLAPNLLMAQTCGYPYARHLRGRVRLLATPVYDAPGCAGPWHRSFVIVRHDAPIHEVGHLRGRRAAINDPGSNSGANLFRALVAPHARGQRFFASVRRTGSHRASLAAVAEGRADVAAIDCVTLANIRRCEPARLAGIRILAETPASPGLPLIAGAAITGRELDALRAALGEAIANPALAQARKDLGLVGFAHVADDAYAAVTRLEAEAVAAGYPRLA